MCSSLLIRLLMILALFFAQQAGAVHALNHTIDDLTQHQKDKQAPNSDSCEECANYDQLDSTFSININYFESLFVSREAIRYTDLSYYRHVLPANARGPPNPKKIA